MIDLFCVSETSLSVGRSDLCDIVCTGDDGISSRHLFFKKEGTDAELLVEGRNGIYVNARFHQAGERINLFYSDYIEFNGLRLIWLSDLITVVSRNLSVTSKLPMFFGKQREDEAMDVVQEDNSMTAIGNSEDHNNYYFTKSPRVYYSMNNEVIELEPPPSKHSDEKTSVFMAAIPAFTMSLPMIMGFVISRAASKGEGLVSSTFMYAGIVTAVCSALIGGMWAITNLKNRRNQLALMEAKRKKAYTDYTLKSELRIKDCYNRNIRNNLLTYPLISDYFIDSHLGGTAGYDEYLLWNRSRNDPDFFSFRIGTGMKPFDATINIPKDKFSLDDDELREIPLKLKEKYRMLKEVPITVDLSEHKCIGVIVNDTVLRNEFFLVMILSMAVSLSPLEISIETIFKKGKISDESIKAIKFLPHLIRQADIEKKSDRYDDDTNDDAHGAIRYVYFTDEMAISLDVLKAENSTVIHFADDFSSLPQMCDLVIQRSINFNGIINLLRESTKRCEVHFDKISIREAETYSRILQGIRTGNSGERAAFPDKVNFYELYGKEIDGFDILANWQKNSTKKSILAPLGIDEYGRVLKLDFHEFGQGPHGLIGGMTGSGKSEVLQTIILSLCVRYSPKEVGFFLIDYKGGGMSKMFGNIPHLMGSISNLSGRMVYRAMVSVKSENERRMRIFADAGVNNITEYLEKYRAGIICEALPHVFIIIDEFAELKREEPEFMTELISVARVGRSLGIHLILATQKPSGTVDDNILSNSRFRICLKVQDRMDSMEMLKRPEAASITVPGRAFLKVGNDELFLKFQGAYTMAKSGLFMNHDILSISDESGINLKKKERYDEKVKDISQLEKTIKAIDFANEKSGKTTIKKLWLNPLKDMLIYEDIKRDDLGINPEINNSKKINTKSFNVPIGIYDNPSGQEQKQLIINFVRSGHIITLGTLQCGKSTLLTTISFALINNATPDNLNMYFIDFNRGMLSPFSKSNKTGIYINEDNEEDIEKLFIMLDEEMEKRKEILKGGNFRQYIESGKGMRALIIVIDGIGAFREKTNLNYDKRIENILKNGEALGVYVIASAISITSSEIPRRLFDHFKVCLPLQLKDRYEYKDAFSGCEDQIMMPEKVRGRGLCLINQKVYEFQTYRVSDAKNDFELSEFISTFINENNRITEALGVCMRVPVIPKSLNQKVFFDTVRKRIEVERFDINSHLPIAFMKKSGKIFGLPLEKDLKVIISGRLGSGKKNLLSIINMSLKEFGLSLADGQEIVIYDEKMPFTQLNEIKNMAGNDPYIIHLGGGIDRLNLADFSYIPYSSQIKITRAGEGIVRKTLKRYEHGEIVIPEFISGT